MMERLQKIIAKEGSFSRRQAEELIRSGKVVVNGKKVTEMGQKFDAETCVIKIAGRVIKTRQEPIYLLFYKPKGCIVTRSDPEGRKTIYEYLPKKYQNLKPVGRLDYDSQGLLILTNDGEFANELMHPQFELEKVYHVKVTSTVATWQMDKMRGGIVIEGRRTQPCTINTLEAKENGTWLQFTLTEGRNRQIRRLCEAVGLTVKNLIRIRVGKATIEGLRAGRFKETTKKKII